MSDVTDILEMKRRVTELVAKQSRLEGQFEEIKRQMKDEFNVTSLKEATAYITKLTEERADLADKLAQKTQQFKDTFAELQDA